jgi:hypothetical protein
MKTYAGTITEWQVHTDDTKSETIISGYCVVDKTGLYSPGFPCITFPLVNLDLKNGKVESSKRYYILEGERAAGRALSADEEYSTVLFNFGPEPDRNGYGPY